MAQAQEIRNFKIEVAYDGRNYCGWQKQINSPQKSSIQEEIAAAAFEISQTKVSLHASGRTDAGVHARAQSAHLRFSIKLPSEKIIKAINSKLPSDIRLISITEMPQDFHAQLQAKSKCYRYFVLQKPNNNCHWPFLYEWTWQISTPLNIEAMQKALLLLQGEHDFTSFQNTGTPVENSVRKLFEASCQIIPSNNLPWMPPTDLDFKLIEFKFHGSGFLKQMVRNLVGTIVEIGKEKREVQSILRILQEKDRKSAGITAPGHALFLDKVFY